MSERFSLDLPAPPPPEPVVATAVVLWRAGDRGREIFLVRRGAERRFAGGFHAFPGGRLDPGDAAVPVAGADAEAAPLVACAVRELFEETGVLAARGAERMDGAARDEARRALLEDRATLADVLERHGLALDAGRFTPLGRWITPPYLPLRYDARQFLLRLPQGERAEVWPGELAAGAFLPAGEILRRWEAGEVLLHPPNLWAVQVLARPGPVEVAALRASPWCDANISRRIEFQRGIWLAALRTPTLPPATHTNAWLVDVGGGLAVVDPGAPDPGEQARLLALLDELAAEGLPPREIWLTHGHADHVGGAAALAAARGLPIRAHPALRARDPELPVVPLREGELLAGRWLVLETPGHARDHVVFLDERTGALLCGDMASTLSTVVIDPPDGDMAAYERQLERLAALAPRNLFPAHGPPAPDAVRRLRTWLDHRHEREGLVRDALRQPGTLEEITVRAYPDVPAVAHPIAARSCLAALEKLAADGLAVRSGRTWASG